MSIDPPDHGDGPVGAEGGAEHVERDAGQARQGHEGGEVGIVGVGDQHPSGDPAQDRPRRLGDARLDPVAVGDPEPRRDRRDRPLGGEAGRRPLGLGPTRRSGPAEGGLDVRPHLLDEGGRGGEDQTVFTGAAGDLDPERESCGAEAAAAPWASRTLPDARLSWPAAAGELGERGPGL